MQAPGVTAKVAYEFSFVRSPVVPNDDDHSGYVSQEMANEPADLFLLDILGVDLKVQAKAFADGAY